jgi:hypothetical protein
MNNDLNPLLVRRDDHGTERDKHRRASISVAIGCESRPRELRDVGNVKRRGPTAACRAAREGR